MAYLISFSDFLDKQCENTDNPDYWCSNELQGDEYKKYCTRDRKKLCSKCESNLLLLNVIKAQQQSIETLKESHQIAIDTLRNEINNIKNVLINKGDMEEEDKIDQ